MVSVEEYIFPNLHPYKLFKKKTLENVYWVKVRFAIPELSMSAPFGTTE